jgi:hypothetical protein
VEPEAVGESVEETGAAKPRNFFSRLGGVYFSPGEAFKEIGRSPSVGAVITALAIIGAISGFWLGQKLDFGALWSQSVAEGKMTLEQANQASAVVSKVLPVILPIGSAVGSLLVTLVIAAIFKLISLFISTENRFKAVFAVTAFTMIAVSIVQTILLVVVLSFKQPADLSIANLSSVVASSLGALLSSTLGDNALPKFVMKLADFVDIFRIWTVVLLAIGYAAVSRKLKTSTAATWIGGLYAVLALISAAIMSRS